MDPFADTSPRPQNVGILAMEVYFPHYYVAQSDLERYNNVPAGKYTIGLGQDAMAFTGDREDVNSIALTCVAGLLEKYNIDPKDIGRLEVGTETLVDKSKSTKTVLMQLFEASGNRNIEGASTINACYGATAAVLNAIAWVESSAWDGRFAIVVAADIAVYAKGAARPTGGCGGVAMLIGPDAPLAIDSKTRVTSAVHVWDFYKPEPLSEYPTVDGSLSQTCYIQSLDDCYTRFCAKNDAVVQRQHRSDEPVAPFTIASVDHAVFHSPYNKLVQKSFARLVFLDARRELERTSASAYPTLAKWLSAPLNDTILDRDLDLSTRALASESYKRKVTPGCATSKQLGNAYTGSVYINLATLVHAHANALDGARILLFSYGSGSIASMFTVRGRTSTDARFSLARIAATLDLDTRLAARQQVSAEEYAVYMDLRERVYGQHSMAPVQPIASVAPGAFYLEGIDAKFHRTYARQPTRQDKDTAAPTLSADAVRGTTSATASVWDSAGAVVVAGVSAAVPGQRTSCDGATSLELLLNGANCIAPLSADATDAILARNIVEVRKSASGAGVERHPVTTRSESVQVAAVVESVDLETQYGIAPALVRSMDAPTQLAVAAGLDALKDAALVDAKWRLAERDQATVGVIYATSFPTMHAAVTESNRFHADPDAELDRKLLFRVLVLANAQLAQITGARGPNTQVNAACAGTTQAIGIAQDWLALGKCTRVVVVASDVASSETLLPYIAGGFRVLGAASTAARVEDAALPFDKRRNGLVLSSGAVGLVLEAPSAFVLRRSVSTTPRVRLLHTRFSNSAYHGASLNPTHVAEELVRFLLDVEQRFGITRDDLAARGVYYSHETCTNASPTASCAFAEVTALRAAFGDARLAKLVIANTKGATGHAMGVAFEDVVAVEGLRRGRVPPVAHFAEHDTHVSEQPLQLAAGGDHVHTYALRFGAGFGSQLAFALFAVA